jgi:hypothetical protein
MFRKSLLAKSALVVASSVVSSLALAADEHVTPSQKAIVRAMGQLLSRDALGKRGMVLNQDGVPIGIRAPISARKALGTGPAKNPPGGRGYSNFSKDKNALFLSWFGWFAGDSHSSYKYSHHTSSYQQVSVFTVTRHLQQSVAEPFTGLKSVGEISLGAEQYSGTGGATVGLYSNAACASGTPSCPGNAITSASLQSPPAFTGLCCSGLETVSIAPTALNKKSTYWIVVGSNGSNGRVTWNGQNDNFTAPPTGAAYKYEGTTVYHTTSYDYLIGTTFFSQHTVHANSNGWIHLNSFSYGEQQAAFHVQ